jgi:hypothetical protein
MEKIRNTGWLKPIARTAFVIIAAVSLAGCIVAPYGPRWHPYYYR